MRTVKYIEKDANGVVLVDEDRPALVHAKRTRSGGFEVVHDGRTHRDAFAAVCKAQRAKFWPGTKAWEVPAEKRAALVDALKADGFQVHEQGVGLV
jgi:hypothetical protein